MVGLLGLILLEFGIFMLNIHGFYVNLCFSLKVVCLVWDFDSFVGL